MFNLQISEIPVEIIWLHLIHIFIRPFLYKFSLIVKYVLIGMSNLALKKML